MKSKKNKFNYGFTLLELIIVLIVITILCAILFIALNPLKRFAQARNSQRWSEVNSILDAISYYRVDHHGNFPLEIDYNWKVLGKATEGCNICDNSAESCLDLEGVITGKYLGKIPIDPQYGSENISYYAVRKTVEDNLEVKSCKAELDSEIILIR